MHAFVLGIFFIDIWEVILLILPLSDEFLMKNDFSECTLAYKNNETHRAMKLVVYT